MKYYVYEWFIKETNEIFYVGKGCGLRYKIVNKHRNFLFQDKIKNNNCESRIIKYFDTEEEAYKYEAQRIRQLKKQGMCVCNIMPGGAGGSGEYWTDELRKQYSENNVMKRSDQRKRMSEQNPMKNADIAKIVGEKHVSSLLIGEKEYHSIKEAAEKEDVSTTTIRAWLINGSTIDGRICNYLDNKKTKRGRPIKPFVYKEKIFYSYEEFRKEYPNITFTSLKNWIANGKDSEGEKCCRYENVLKTGNHSRGNSIEVNGIVYPSVNLASAKLNISRRSLDRYAKGLVKNKDFICKYI